MAPFGAAALAAYSIYWSDERRHEVTIILNKYQDPLLLAAAALRHKFKGITFRVGSGTPPLCHSRVDDIGISPIPDDNSSIVIGTQDPPPLPSPSGSSSPRSPSRPSNSTTPSNPRSPSSPTNPTATILQPRPTVSPIATQMVVDDYIIIHTAFLVGQFFCWVYILREESQFISIQRTQKTTSLTNAFFKIEETWSRFSGGDFRLLRGELMTVTNDGQRSWVMLHFVGVGTMIRSSKIGLAISPIEMN